MAAKKRIAPTPEPSEQQAEAVARNLIASKSGLAGSEFKKELPAGLRGHERVIVDAAERLASQGQVHRWSSTTKVRFFSTNPLDLVPPAVQEALERGPATEAALAKHAGSKNRGTQDLVKEWLKGAVARGEVFAYPPANGSKVKRYWKEPDPASLMKKVLVELKKVFGSAAGRHLSRERALEVIAQELGIQTTPFGSGGTENHRQRFLAGLTECTREQPKNALLSVREVRSRVGIDKQRFDAIALELQAENGIILHHHDHPEALPELERSQLIVDAKGVHYHGIALRSGS